MKKTQKIIILVLILVALLVFGVLNKKERQVVENIQTQSPYLNSNIEVRTFQGENGWGYDIFIDGAQYVHQPNIPALSGNLGFENESNAKSVAELMVEKIRKNILPPGVTEEEVKAILEK